MVIGMFQMRKPWQFCWGIIFPYLLRFKKNLQLLFLFSLLRYSRLFSLSKSYLCIILSFYLISLQTTECCANDVSRLFVVLLPFFRFLVIYLLIVFCGVVTNLNLSSTTFQSGHCLKDLFSFCKKIIILYDYDAVWITK